VSGCRGARVCDAAPPNGPAVDLSSGAGGLSVGRVSLTTEGCVEPRCAGQDGHLRPGWRSHGIEVAFACALGGASLGDEWPSRMP
jgi:hypothetical protein